MKNFLFLMAMASLLVMGCKENKPTPGAATTTDPIGATDVGTAPATDSKAVDLQKIHQEDYTFDQLFSIFSLFGGNIMTDKFAAQSVKDRIRDELRDSFDGYREFIHPVCNNLSYSLFGGDCYDGFQLGCWKYDADGHILVLLAENGGCDASATKYIRAYEYDPETKNAREVEFPLNPVPRGDDFNDIIRLAGCEDLVNLRATMRDRVFNYRFDTEGITIDLNTLDNWDVAENSALQLYYRWNGSEFVRDESVPVPCIHGDGFALILLGLPIPDLYLQPDPIGYGINYSQGGDLWEVNLGEQDVLQVQMEDGKVYSIEVFDPRYSLTRNLYWDGDARLCVGSRINDFFTFPSDDVAVWLYSDGTVAIEFEQYDALLQCRTTKDDLQGRLPSVGVNDVRVKLENPQFKPNAQVRSIYLKKAQNG
ncbi:MAG: hypothetical protein IJP77_00955 [Bacteroidales bacterium]|nr:hypothetical protein [Bacteroidales bacterium]